MFLNCLLYKIVTVMWFTYSHSPTHDTPWARGKVEN